MFDRLDKGIFWDESLNLVLGCTPVSAGCSGCWSARETAMRQNHPNEKIHSRAMGLLNDAGAYNGFIGLNHDEIKRPWHAKRPRAYAIWTDLFHPGVPHHFIDKVLEMIALCPYDHIFIVVTKRPELALEKLYGGENRYLPPGATLSNLWFLVTMENQAVASERVAGAIKLKRSGTCGSGSWPMVGILAEPLLGPIDLWQAVYGVPFEERDKMSPMNSLSSLDGFGSGLDWIVAGGESGKGARPMHPDWIKSLCDQAEDSGIPFLFKGWGEWTSQRSFSNFLQWVNKASTWIQGGKCIDISGKPMTCGKDFREAVFPVAIMHHVGKRNSGRILEGRARDELPKLEGVKFQCQTSNQN